MVVPIREDAQNQNHRKWAKTTESCRLHFLSSRLKIVLSFSFPRFVIVHFSASISWASKSCRTQFLMSCYFLCSLDEAACRLLCLANLANRELCSLSMFFMRLLDHYNLSFWWSLRAWSVPCRMSSCRCWPLHGQTNIRRELYFIFSPSPSASALFLSSVISRGDGRSFSGGPVGGDGWRQAKSGWSL